MNKYMPYKNPFSVVDLKSKRQGKHGPHFCYGFLHFQSPKMVYTYVPAYFLFLICYSVCCGAKYF